jgi:quercetin dioxygenase-like cupin family protein
MKTRTAVWLGPCLAIGIVSSAAAADTRAVDMKALTTPTDALVLHRKDVPQVTVYVWQNDGVQHEAWPGSAEKPPTDAVAVKERIFPFHDGVLREVMYPKGALLTSIVKDDTLSYLLSGHLVQTVNGAAHDMRPGDASFLTEGTKDTKQAVEPTTLMVYHFPTNGEPPLDPVWISSKDVPAPPASAWVVDGVYHVAHTPEDIAKAPPEAKQFFLQTYPFPRWKLIISHVEKGLNSGFHSSMSNGIIYLAKGRIHMHYQSGLNEEIETGDVFREPPTNFVANEAPEDLFLVKVAVAEDGKPAR